MEYSRVALLYACRTFALTQSCNMTCTLQHTIIT
jgi:hypothetical protein